MSGNVGFTNLKPLALALRDEFGLDTFIETGTYKAQTTTWAAENFKRVVSIEANEELHQRAVKVLGDTKNTRLILGDSAEELGKVARRLKKPALIWLDAHWCKGVKELPECPLVDELKAIRESGLAHFILIDDARLFTSPPNPPHKAEEWPAYGEVKGMIPEGYYITIWNDAIIAVPHEAKALVERFTEPAQELEVIVLTSNAYLQCLPPFAYLFNQFWGKEQAVKVVRYEVRPRNLPANFTNFAIGNQAEYTWSSGLLKYLEHHKGNLILLMLEDYFIDQTVNEIVMGWAWSYMLDHPEIAKIDLTNDRLKVAHTQYDKAMGLIQSDPDTQFQTSTQAAIWRVDYLKRFLDPDENPWQFERRGTKRVIRAREAGEFDGLILGFKNPPLSYINAVGGEGNNPGAWDRKKFPSWMWSELNGRGLV